MADIAAEAGISKPVLYHHFGDKAGLAAAIADRFLAELEAGDVKREKVGSAAESGQDA